MTNEEILQKAIEKALNNNWDVMLPLISTYALELANPDKVIQAVRSKRSINDIIFDNSFAQAFWGEEELEEETNDLVAGKRIKMTHGIAWKYHLKQMVLEDEPLKYVERFL